MKKNIFAFVALLSLTSFGYAQTDSQPVMPVPPMPAAPGAVEPVAMDVDTVAVADTLAVDSLSADSVQSFGKMKRISLGLRGGLAMSTGYKDILTHHAGGNIAFDFQYAMYWPVKTTQLGFLVGASVNFVETGASLKSAAMDQFSAETGFGKIDYTITANNVAEKQRQLMVEIPLMFDLVDKSGVFFNFGPRFVIPAWTRSVVSFEDPCILAYFPEEDVPVPNEMITGEVIGDWTKGQKAEWNAPFFRLQLGGEIGYEFRMKSGNALAVGLYADCEVWNDLDLTVDVPKSFIGVKAPTSGADPKAKVSVHSPIALYAPNAGMFDLGLKLTYHFNLKK